MPTRKANAEWHGDLKAGKGYKGAFSFQSRMEEAPGTNPEELIAAAHAGCYTMALSGDLGRAGFTADSINTTANVAFSNSSGKWTIDSIHLDCTAKVPGLDDAKFQEIAAGTKDNCPVSRALASVKDISVSAKLG
jgi:osmotically inducible protein OsmC